MKPFTFKSYQQAAHALTLLARGSAVVDAPPEHWRKNQGGPVGAGTGWRVIWQAHMTTHRP